MSTDYTSFTDLLNDELVREGYDPTTFDHPSEISRAFAELTSQSPGSTGSLIEADLRPDATTARSSGTWLSYTGRYGNYGDGVDGALLRV